MEEQLAPMYLSDDAVPLPSNCGIPGCLIGWVVGVEETGFPLVDYQDNTKGPLPARYTISPGSGGWKAAWSANSHIVLIFELGDPVRPIIIGVMRSPLDEVIDRRIPFSMRCRRQIKTGLLRCIHPRGRFERARNRDRGEPNG